MKKVIVSKSGRKIILHGYETPHDFGQAHQRELLESYDLGKGETFFSVFCKMVLFMTIFFCIGVLIRYYY